MAESFPYKTPPLPYQRPILQATAMQEAHFLAMEQGTGKTYVTLNTAAALYLKGRIQGMVVIAPNGVHAQWVYDQVPQHLPTCVPVQPYLWRSAREKAATNRTGRPMSEALQAFLQLPADGTVFPMLVLNSEAMGVVPLVEKVLRRFLMRFPSLMVVDESSDFSSPSAKRTRVLLRMARLARYRRCLDGTPVGGAPWDLWAPYFFLHPQILRYPRVRAMKDMHGEWITVQKKDANGMPVGRAFQVLRTERGQPVYRNLGMLQERIAPYTTRVTKAAVLPFLPPKHFTKHYFELAPEQTALMQQLRDDFLAQLDDGATASASNVLSVLLRCQQIAHGYVACDPDWDAPQAEPRAEPTVALLAKNPRLDAALQVLDTQLLPYGSTIIWTRFRLDVPPLVAALQARGLAHGVYDGSTSDHNRQAMIQAFQAGTIPVLIANAAAAARGLDLYRASSVLYYGNYYGLRRRLQSEDRAHRVGTQRTVRYVDLIGVDPVAADPLRHSPDHKIVRALRSNKNLADLLTGDPTLLDWL